MARAEQELRISLPADIRARTPQEVQVGQTLLRPLPDIPRLPTPPPQTFARPSDLVPRPRDPDFLDRFAKIIPLGFVVAPGTTETKPLRELITKPGFTFLEKELGISKEDISRLGTFSDEGIDRRFGRLSESTRDKIKDVSNLQRNLQLGILKEIEENPEKIVAVTAAAFLLPGLTATGRSLPIVANVLNKIPAPVKKQGARVIQGALGSLYLASSGLQIAEQPTPELKAQKVGRILTSEVVPFSIGSRLGVKSFLRNEVKKEIKVELDKLPRDKRAAFEDYMRQAEVLGRFEPKTKNIKLDNVESLPTIKSQKAMRDYLRANKGEVTVGGSVAQTGQIKVGRKLGDLDLYLETKNPSQAAREFASFMRGKGVERVAISPRNPTTVTIAGKKVADFQNIERLLTNIKQVIPFYQDPRRYLIKTPEGIQIQRIGLQVRRKLVAAFADPKRLATGKFRKDLKDFKNIADKLFRRAELNARSSFFFRESKIKRLEKEFGVKISRKIPTEKVKVKPFEKKVIKPVKKPTLATKKTLKFRESPLRQRARLMAGRKPFTKIKPSQARLIKTRRIRLIASQPFAKLRKPPKRIIPSQPPSEVKKKDILTPPIFRRPPLIPPPSRVLPSQPPSKPPRKPPILTPAKFRIPPIFGKPIKRPPVKPPRAPVPSQFLKRKLPKQFRQSPSFDLLVRKRKKFIVRGRRLPFNLALQRGAIRLDNTLRATARLRPNPRSPLKKDVARPRLNPRLFRRPKRTSPLFKPNTLTFIERRNKRLSTKGETQSIKKFRRLKKR